ncbi:MAG TPA: GNAT family N-acetyltransferase [Chitinophagaceae bacterium]|nr:GNAT family N-acetyltransferase [Chitinophagaceae bacterium]
MPIAFAERNDVSSLVTLMDSAYRGEGSKQGWTSEADLFIGNKRTDEATVAELIAKPGSVFLKYITENSIIEGCVYLHKKESKLYLGMFSVTPSAQGKGIGKKLLAAADEYAKQQDCTSIYMTVITLREDLIAWYEKNGYQKTDRVLPFPVDERYGIPTRPLEVIVLEKHI